MSVVPSNQRMSSFTKLTFFLLAVLCTSIAAAQNVIINGDFDDPPYDTIGAVSGWTVTGSVGAVGDEGFTTPDHAAAFSLGGNSDGNMLSQSFATIPGQAYTLDFDAGVYGIRSLGPLQLQIQVTGTGTLLTETVIPPYNGNFNPAPFDHFMFSFIADSASATLKFNDIGLGNNAADIILDTVSVAAIPEPTSLVLVMVGAVPLLGYIRRRRFG